MAVADDLAMTLVITLTLMGLNVPHSFINRGKNPKKIVAGAFGIRLIWNLPKHQTFQPKSHLQ